MNFGILFIDFQEFLYFYLLAKDFLYFFLVSSPNLHLEFILALETKLLYFFKYLIEHLLL